MKILLMIIGSIFGVLVVRQFFLSSLQASYFDMMWRGARNGDLVFSWEVFLKSQLFLKCLAGLLAGALAGSLLSRLYGIKKRKT